MTSVLSLLSLVILIYVIRHGWDVILVAQHLVSGELEENEDQSQHEGPQARCGVHCKTGRRCLSLLVCLLVSFFLSFFACLVVCIVK